MDFNCLNCATPLNLKGNINDTTSGFYGRCPNCGKIIIIENGKLITEPTFSEALENSYAEQLKQIGANNNFFYLKKHITIVKAIKRIFNNMYAQKINSKKPVTNVQVPTFNKFDIEVLKMHLNWVNKEKMSFDMQNLQEKDKENILQTLKIINYIKQYRDKNTNKTIPKKNAKTQKQTKFTIFTITIMFLIVPASYLFSLNEKLIQIITFIPKTIFPFIETLSLVSGNYSWILMLFSLSFFFLIIFTPLRFFSLIKEENKPDFTEYKTLTGLVVLFFMFFPLFIFSYIIPNNTLISFFAEINNNEKNFELVFLCSLAIMVSGLEFLSRLAHVIYKKYFKKDSISNILLLKN